MADKPGNPSAETRRKQRLAAALRENLKRRKAQVRGREDAKAPAQEPGGPAKD